jgi:hypothetical protein
VAKFTLRKTYTKISLYMGQKLNCVHSSLIVRILSSTSVPFTLMNSANFRTIQVVIACGNGNYLSLVLPTMVVPKLRMLLRGNLSEL